MNDKAVLITAPALDAKNNVSGVSSVANFIIANNELFKYRHFELGRKDGEAGKITLLLRMAKTYCKWMAVILFGKIKLVHFNFALSKASIIRDAPLVLFAKLLRKKVIVHLHGGDYLFAKQAPGWMLFLLKRVFNGNTPVLVLSSAEADVVKQKFAAKNVYVLPNCVDLKDAAAFNRSDNETTPLQLLFIGRISSTKGLDFIYTALDELKKANLPFKFLMAGAGPQLAEYVQKFSSLLAGDFEFKGVVSGQAKTNLYKSCNVFLLPSLFEGMPMSLLEAMSFGLVPVVTNVGSVSTVVNNENGFIITLDEKTTVTAIVTSVTALHNNRQLLAQISKAAKEDIHKNFSPAAYINELNKIYATA